MESKPVLLDLFCGAGGASVGYANAGFEVVGVDILNQKNYPFRFYQADALSFSLKGFDYIHASPPCQDHSRLKHSGRSIDGSAWILEYTVNRLIESGIPWIVENVDSAFFPNWLNVVKLCGSSFGLGVRRHRLFASMDPIFSLPCRHKEQGKTVTVSGHGMHGRDIKKRRDAGLPLDSQTDRNVAMGIDWMNRDELSQAIPPAYTEFLGLQVVVGLGSSTSLK